MDYFNKYLTSLPQPLGKEEQENLLKEYSLTKSDAVREKIIVHNLRLVASVVYKYFDYSNPKYEDAMQVGTIGLMKAIDNYDGSKGCSFSTYAYACLRGVIMRELNKGLSSCDAIGHCTFQSSMSEDDQHLFYNIGDDDNIHEDMVESERINGCLSELNDEDRFIVEHRLCLNNKKQLTISEIAIRLGKNPSYVEKRFLKVREMIIKYYLNDADMGRDLAKYREAYENKGLSIDDVMSYYEGLNSQRNREIIEYMYGLFGKPCLAKAEIAKRLGVEASVVYGLHRRLVKKAQKHSMQGVKGNNAYVAIKDIEDYCKSMEDGDKKDIVEYFYGFNGKDKLSCKEIAQMFGCMTHSVYGILYATKDKIRNSKPLER